MNRKQRRAAGSSGSSPAAPDGAALFVSAVQFHREGRLAEAETLYRRVLALDPKRADALHRLGLIAYQSGHADAAIGYLDRAVAADATIAAYHVHRGLALAAAGRLDEALAACAAAVQLDPDSVEAQVNLGLVLMQADRFDDAAQAARRAVALSPDLADGHNILGGALQSLGHTDEAIYSLQRAIALAPDFAEAHNGLGQALAQQGRLREAAQHFRLAIAADPAFALAYSHLAGVMKMAGDLEGAAANLRQAAQLAPRHPAILNNLARILLAQGDGPGAMTVLLHGLAVAETSALRQTFVHCASSLRTAEDSQGLRAFLIRAFRESWGRPEDLVRLALDLVKQGPALAHGGQLAALAEDDLLLTLLTVTPNIDIDVERVLTCTRATLLQAAEAGISLSPRETAAAAALARQAFINEYVFALDPDEAERTMRLSDDPVSATSLLAAACYGLLPSAGPLTTQSWATPVQAVLTMQLAEPAEEARLRRDIPRMTPILETSLQVQAQYEENPYPRWIGTTVSGPLERLATHLASAYPLADLAPVADGDIEVLIAGCGTGRNALETHQSFLGATTLAIDLSIASLAYAQRKANAMNVTGLTFAQADLLEIAALGRTFDLVEASGVLHHLADPYEGWRALLSVLRPAGVMRLGFYSELARRNLPELNISDPTPEAIRSVRQILAARDEAAARQALLAQDFYSMSACRDLLFHTREHRYGLRDLAAFMCEHGLRFIGFVIDNAVLAAYQRRFPDDPAGRDLKAWAAFEEDHPDTFAGMYQFWVQKI